MEEKSEFELFMCVYRARVQSFLQEVVGPELIVDQTFIDDVRALIKNGIDRGTAIFETCYKRGYFWQGRLLAFTKTI